MIAGASHRASTNVPSTIPPTSKNQSRLRHQRRQQPADPPFVGGLPYVVGMELNDRPVGLVGEPDAPHLLELLLGQLSAVTVGFLNLPSASPTPQAGVSRA